MRNPAAKLSSQVVSSGASQYRTCHPLPRSLQWSGHRSSFPRGVASRRWDAGVTRPAHHRDAAPGATPTRRSPDHRRIRPPAHTRPDRRSHRAASRADRPGHAPGTRLGRPAPGRSPPSGGCGRTPPPARRGG
jgi:hypothetical protein